MAEQNYKNHTRWVPVWHFIIYPLMLATIVGACVNLYETCQEDRNDNLYSAALLVMISILILLIAIFARHFALKAQDRAIRAEENIRFMGITGKLLDPRLSMRQIIALRFASNNELLDLERMAVENNLAPADIKKAIKHWRADNNRI